jgi:DNA polymerase elongation subunit (family B)
VTLANEKVYKPYLLIQKKTYAGLKHTLKAKCTGETMDHFDIHLDLKGIDAVRRDRSKLIKTLSMSILEELMYKGSIEAASKTLKETLRSVATHEAPLDLFILSKSLKGTYASENQPHVQAWRRMIARGDPDIPEIGSRMPFVVVQGRPGMKEGPLYERTEHPEHVKTAKLKYSAKYYLENAQDVIERLLSPTPLGLQVKTIFQEALASAEHKASGNMSLMSFLGKRKLEKM